MVTYQIHYLPTRQLLDYIYPDSILALRKLYLSYFVELWSLINIVCNIVTLRQVRSNLIKQTI